jgi:hypothetical protein
MPTLSTSSSTRLLSTCSLPSTRPSRQPRTTPTLASAPRTVSTPSQRSMDLLR